MAHPLVLVEWVDSSRVVDWQPIKDLESSVTRCRSVGWVAVDADDCIVIVPHMDDDGWQGCGGMTIPKVAITRRVEIDVSESRRASA